MNAAGLSWQVAQVLESSDRRLRLRFSRPEFCQRCQRGNGCGAGVFSGLFPRRTTEIEIDSDQDLAHGDWVRVGLAHRDLALGAARVYGLPLAAFVAGALPAHWLIGAEGWRDLAALAGGLVAAVLAYVLAQRFFRSPVNPIVQPLSCGSDGTKSTASEGVD